MTSSGSAKAVILGGGGFIGSAVARRFDAAGYDVLAVGYRDIDRPNLRDTSVRVVLGDDSSPENLANWFDGASIIVDCGTPYPVWMFAGEDRTSPKAAVHRVRAILEAVKSTNAGFLLISSFTTLPRQEGMFGAIRRGALSGSHPYFELKERVEAEVQAHLDQGHPGAIFAPGTCFGPFDLKPREQTFIPMLLSGKVPVMASKDMNIIDVRDLAEVVFAARHGRFSSPIPVFGHNINLKHLAKLICEIGGGVEPKFSMPATMGAAGLYVMETVYAVAGKKTPWPSVSVLLLAASYAASPSKTQLQLHPTLLPMSQTLRDSIEWYESIGYL